ncbi:MAG TPA: putative DNA modification/repair radical SAM protein [Clostridia bacterium]
MELFERIKVLSAGAKYDVSCSSSGSDRKNPGNMTGNTAACGICHSFTEDGRCVSLLKILMSNDCIFDCQYCVNRRSNNIARASLTPKELCELTMGFYRRNYIEGLFLSSAVVVNPNHTMELLLQTVKSLREEYGFNGYIHLKAIPHADQMLIDQAALYADRMSVNIELPTAQSLKLLAPSKTKESILKPMKQLSNIYLNAQELSKSNRLLGTSEAIISDFIPKPRQSGLKKPIPAGQTTQLIVGATPDSDGVILKLSEALYRHYRLKRVYYSAYEPVGNPTLLPTKPANLKRENRLYQADWLIRFYGFSVDEFISPEANLNYDLDPKTDWALRNMDKFPVEVNTAPYEVLLRVPGIGIKNAWRIVRARKTGRLTLDDLKRMKVVLKRAQNFITINGKFYGINNYNRLNQYMLSEANEQISMFDDFKQSLVTGEF